MREEEKKRSSQDSSIKRFFKKRWVFPAIYLGSAAILLTAVLWYQNSASNNTDDFDYEATDVAEKKFNDPAVEVTRAMENVVMPVADPMKAVIQKGFYDVKASDEKQEAALVFYDNQYHPNTGIDITMKEGQSFDVVAALSGKVTKVVDNDALLGNVIEIEHDKGIVTQYQSVSDIKVKVGDEVEQGDVIAKAGESQVNEEAGIHVHFEIRKDSVAVNPSDYFQKPLSALQELNVTSSDTEDANAEGTVEESTKTSDEKATDEEATKDDAADKKADESTDKKEDADKSTDTPDSEQGTDSTKSSDA